MRPARALFAYLANGSERSVALGALVSSIVGITLALSSLGVYAYAIPALSGSFLNGRPESIRIIDAIFVGPLGSILTLTFLLYSAGFVLFGVAIWRSGTLPRWAGTLVAAHAPLISGPFSVVGSVVGSLLAVAGGCWIALSVLQGHSAQPMEAEAGPRVEELL